ncbi:hypothetical protein D4R87_02795 [bacterium]|nr:MAG: hypothetical protein D4R87_02795 [bacterium]
MDNQEQQNKEISWAAFEYFYYPKTRNWFIATIIISALMMVAAISSQDPLVMIVAAMAIVVFFMTAVKMPKEVQITLKEDGILFGEKNIPYKTLGSFWIFYDPPINYISFKKVGKLTQPIKIVFGDEIEPLKIREFLAPHLPEKEQEESMMDAMERILRL